MASTRPDPLLAGTIALNHKCDSNQVAAACGGGDGLWTVLTAEVVDFVDFVGI